MPMPEHYNKPKWRLRPVFGLGAAAELGNLLKVTCRRCRRVRYFLPADLVEIYGDREVDDCRPLFPCSRCGDYDRVVLDLYAPSGGDAGVLDVCRPKRMQVVKWRIVKLGDEPR